MSRLPTKLALATHECGHAVARLALTSMFRAPAPRLRSVSIGMTADWLGIAEMDARFFMSTAALMPSLPDEFRAAILRSVRLDIIETLAGPLAETRRTQGTWLAGLLQMEPACAVILAGGDDDPGSDASSAATRLQYLMRHTPGTSSDVLERLWRAAWTLVEMEWTGIDRLSRRLVQATAMEGDDFTQAWAEVRTKPGVRERRRQDAGLENSAALDWAASLEVMA